MNTEEIFDDKAFDCLEPERKKAFMHLYDKLQGKTPEQAIPIVLAFARQMPQGHKITEIEKNAMVAAVTARMTPREKARVEAVLKMVL